MSHDNEATSITPINATDVGRMLSTAVGGIAPMTDVQTIRATMQRLVGDEAFWHRVETIRTMTLDQLKDDAGLVLEAFGKAEAAR